MNSLVVFLSMVALAAAKPSQLFDAGLLAYSAPVVAVAPSAVSTQSRLDIKSSPAIVSTAAFAPLAARTVIAEPALLAAPAAVSHQSRLDIKSTPAITSTVVAAAPIAYSGYGAPIAYSGYGAPIAFSGYDAPIAYGGYGAPIATAAIAPTVVKTAAIAPAFAAPAVIKTAAFVPGVIGAPALPLDTPEVIAARAAHLEAKALTEAHIIRKRSVSVLPAPLLSSPIVSTYASSPVISTYGLSPLTYNTHLTSPIVTKTYGLW